MNIGIMGGTFNPVHSGHIAFIQTFIRQIHLDICYVIPARRSPFRMNEPLADDMHRLAMLQLACKDFDNVIVSDIEIKREGFSFTIDTIQELQEIYPDARFFLLIGEDQAHRFKEWKSWEDVMSLVQLCIVQRSKEANMEQLIQELSEDRDVLQPIMLKSPLFHVSSTLIRESMVLGNSIHGLVPDLVEQYIHEHNLYRES